MSLSREMPMSSGTTAAAWFRRWVGLSFKACSEPHAEVVLPSRTEGTRHS